MAQLNAQTKPRRAAPLSLRLSDDERSRLQKQAGSLTLGAYIKSVVFSDAAPKYRKRKTPPSAEKRLLAEILARLGESRTANNLNQIAKHLNQGTLVVDDDLEQELKQAVAEVAWMRATLLDALKGGS